MGLVDWYERVSARVYPEHAKRAVNTWLALILGTLVLVFATYRILVCGFFDFSGKGVKIYIVGSAAWVLYFGLSCFGLAMFGLALGLQAKGQDRLTYRHLQRWGIRMGTVMIGAGVFMNILQRW